MTAAENLNLFWASLIVDELVRLGIRLFCISPGSRSAPLAVAVARHQEAEAVIAHDERGAAYLAVGYAKACGKPAAVIATSGTAGANYFPAVVEASADWTPLLVLTADRPPELQDVGANQTIRQSRLFGEFARLSVTLPCPDEKISPDFILSSLDWAIAAAVEKSGPVHINLMFREPLAPTLKPFSFSPSPAFSRWQQNREPFTVYVRPHVDGQETALQILPLLKNASHPLLIVGRRSPCHDWSAMADLISALQWPTHIDVLHPLRFAFLEAPLLDEHRLPAELHVDCVLHLGGPFLSKRLQTMLEANPPRCFIHIDEFLRRTDPGHWVTHRFTA
ncbi:MAG: 2-succinyl-5-enolpyruvyl-6-hydroxy-3-cyclohexene-1-carboxylic-acid synthase, partial [candidate division KSB1 bacterium]|nr:2-succinyl-5-enolpyruvyl-6-hydroxy-3-cyclohexene-1-carboxylic-acid synthase [candidate division KSB1 bacterium]